MRATCPFCLKVSQLRDADAGLPVICVACGARFQAPSALPMAASTPVAEPQLHTGPTEPHAEPTRRGGAMLGAWVAAGTVMLLAVIAWGAWAARSTSWTPRPTTAIATGRSAEDSSRPTSAPTTQPVPRAVAGAPTTTTAPAPQQVAARATTMSAAPPVVTVPAAPVVVAPPPTTPASSPSPRPFAPLVIPRPPTTRLATAAADLTDEQIGKAIKKAADYLLAQFDPRTRLLKQMENDSNGIIIGEDILCVYALLQAGQAIDDPRLNPKEATMKGLVAAMRGLKLGQYRWEVYARALRATALAVYDRPEDRQVLTADISALIAGAHDGNYTYSTTRRRGPRSGDNSNAQYGLLGVWSGAEAGREVPRAYWEAVSRHWERTQSANGQWAYTGGWQSGTHSMTCAGLASLFVAHDYLEPARFTGNVGRDPFIPAVAKGLKWLEAGDNAVELDRGGYDLYGLERVGLASGFKYFGRHDWYRELAKESVASQLADGSWGGTWGYYGYQVETAYSLLFLSRGRHPVMMNKLRFDGGYWANRPRDVANLTRFAARQLERPLNWQVVPLERDWTEWADSPVLYLASHQPVKLSDEDCTKIRAFVENGGMLFTQADGDSAEFNRFATQLAPRLFGTELVDVPANHPIYNAMFAVKPVAGLKMATNGSRVLMLHAGTDVSRIWEIRDDKRKPEVFQFGTNLFIYAAGKRDLRNRLASTYLPPVATPPTAIFRIARLSYAGNWNPEPAAWGRFARWFGGETGYGLDVVETPIRELKVATAPFATLTGTARYDLTDDEAAAIKAYVEGGGVLLVDMCGGTGAFDSGLQSSLYFKAFADNPPRVMGAAHPMLDGEGGNGMEELSKPRLRTYAVERLGGRGGLPEVIGAGRGHVILTSLDVTTGLLGAQTWGILGYESNYAQSLVKNAILWTLDGQKD